MSTNLSPTPTLRIPIGSSFVSDSITMPQTGYLFVSAVATATDHQPTLIVTKNGQQVSNSVTPPQPIAVSAGDILAFAFVVDGYASPHTIDLRLVAGIQSDSELYASGSIVAISEEDPSLYSVEDYADFDPVMISRLVDGTSFTPGNRRNAVIVRETLDGEAIATVSISRPVESPIVTTNELLAIPCYAQKFVQLFDTVDNVVVRTLHVDGKPFAVSRINFVSAASNDYVVSLPDVNKVVVIDSTTFSVVASFDVEGSPAGMAVNSSGDSLMVACLNAVGGKFVLWHWTASGSSYIPVSDVEAPMYVAYDAAANSYIVSSPKQTRLLHVSASGSVAEHSLSAATGSASSLRSTVVVNGIAFTCDGLAPGFHTVSAGDSTTQFHALSSDSYPYCAGRSSSGNTIIGGIGAEGTRWLFEVNATGVLNSVTTKTHPYFIYPRLAGGFFEVSMWDNVPDMIAVRDMLCQEFVIDDVEDVRNTVVTTNAFTVLDVDVPIPAVLSSAYTDSTIIVNGQEVGRATTVAENDLVAVKVTLPDRYDEQSTFVLAVGNKYARVNFASKPANEIPDAVTFYPAVDVAVGSVQTSNTVTITGLDSGVSVQCVAVAKSGQSCTLLINGVESPSGTLVSNSDIVALRTTASTTNNTPVFVLVTIGIVESVWSVVTESPDNLPYYMPVNDVGSTPLDWMAKYGVTDSNVDRNYNRVLAVNVSDFSVVRKWDLEATPDDFQSSSLSGLFVTDYLSHKIYKVDPASTSGAPAKNWSFNQRIYGLAASPSAVSSSVVGYYTAVPDGNSIVRFGDKTQVLPVYYTSIGADPLPLGVAVAGDNVLYAACSWGGVAFWEYNAATDSYIVPAPGQLYIVWLPGSGRLCDAVGDTDSVWIADVRNGYIHNVSRTTIRSTSTVGFLPIKITLSSTRVYCANFGSSSLSYFNKNTPLNVTTVPLPKGYSQPTCIEYDSNSNLIFVACPRDGKVLKLTADLEYVAEINVSDLATNVVPFSVQVIDGVLYIGSMYGNILEQFNIGTLRLPMDSMTFDSPILDLQPAETTTTTTATIAEIAVMREPVYIEPYTGALLSKNGGVGATVVSLLNGDSIRATVVAPDKNAESRTVNIWSYGKRTSVELETVADKVPTTIKFATSQNLVPGQLVRSNSVTITGLGPDVVTVIEIKPDADRPAQEGYDQQPLIYLNGSEEGATSVPVKNGDTISLSFRVYGIAWNGDRAVITLVNDADQQFATWTLITGYLFGAIKWVDQDEKPRVESVAWSPALHINTDPDAAYASIWLSEIHIGSICDSSVPSVEIATQATIGVATLQYDWTYKSHTTIVQHDGDPLRAVIGITSRVFDSTADAQPFDKHMRSHGTSTLVSVGFEQTSGSETVFGAEPMYARFPSIVVATTGLPEFGILANYSTDALIKVVVGGYVLDTSYAPPSVVPTTTSYELETQGQELLTDADWLVSNPYATRPVDTDFDRILYYTTAETASSWSMFARRADHETESAYGATVRAVYQTAIGVDYQTGSSIHATYVDQDYNLVSFHDTSAVDLGGYERTDYQTTSTVEQYAECLTYTASVSIPTSFVQHTTGPVFDDFVYTAAQIRAYDTEQQAIEENTSDIRPVVYATQMYDGYWAWNIPAVFDRAECDYGELGNLILGGYIQGG